MASTIVFYNDKYPEISGEPRYLKFGVAANVPLTTAPASGILMYGLGSLPFAALYLADDTQVYKDVRGYANFPSSEVPFEDVPVIGWFQTWCGLTNALMFDTRIHANQRSILVSSHMRMIKRTLGQLGLTMVERDQLLTYLSHGAPSYPLSTLATLPELPAGLDVY